MLQLAVSDEDFSGMLAESDEHVRGAFARLLARAADEGTVDAGLDPARAARWLVGLVDTLYLMCGDDGFDAEAEVAELKRIAARYLGS